MVTEWRPCGRGICAAEEGHAGSCARASGWLIERWCEECEWWWVAAETAEEADYFVRLHRQRHHGEPWALV